LRGPTGSRGSVPSLKRGTDSRADAAALETHVPMNTRGSTLLAGNVYCGHCGARPDSAKREHAKAADELATLRAEVVKSIRGESSFSTETLGSLLKEAEDKPA